MSPLMVVILVVLVDLLGFSIVMPLLPPLAKQHGLSDLQVGLLFAAFPLCQLVAGPILGRLSDRFGRRPLLVVSQAGTALSFVILALAPNYSVMLLGRMLDGASGGNILVAQAYVADVTKPEERARGFGLIGAAFGVGFVLGPLLGGLLVDLPVDPAWRLRVPFLVAAGFSSLAWVLVLLRLPESRTDAGATAARVLSWRGLVRTVTDARVAVLVAVAALTTLAFAALEGTFSLFLADRMGWGPESGSDKVAYSFAYLGLVSAMVQGGLIRRLAPRFGEPALIVSGLATLAVGLGLMGAVASVPMLLGVLLVVGLGQGLANPAIQGLLSRRTPASDQGAVFGTLSSAQTLARTVNYPVAAWLLGRFGASAPFLEAAGLAAAALLLALGAVGRSVTRERAEEWSAESV